MFKNEYTLTVDLKKKMTAIVPKFVQYDNATLVFKIFDGGKSYDLTTFTRAEVAHKRPDGKVIVGTGIIETLSNGEKVIRYEYLGNEMNKTGYVETSLSIFSTDKKVSIQPFKVVIVTDNRDGLVENSKPEVGLLQELIAQVSEVLIEANTAIDKANNAVTIANKATDDANTAITNANLAVTEAQNAANETIQVKDDTLIAKAEAEQATINANNAVSNLVHKGEYSPVSSYVLRNIISFDGSSYMNILPCTGISPTDNTHWKLIGKKGDTGERGIQGAKGEKGDKGDTGKGFSIAKTYPSVAAMYADYSNPSIEIGSFVLINTPDISNVENAMLFVKTVIEYSYLTDLSGAQGIKGEKGIDGISFNWRDSYVNTTSYLKNDVVSYNGSSYIALQASKGNLPTNVLFWSMVAQKGVDGTGSVSSVNTKFPNVNGEVTLTPSDIGASPSNHTHSDLETVIDSNSKLATKVDKVAGKQLSTEDFTTTEKTKLSGIATNANNYSHPATHPPSIIAQDTSNRFMTDAEKTKLSGIATNANNYTHPANHPASIITQDASNRFVTDTEKTTWNAKASNSLATTSANGLMSSADKVLLSSLDTKTGDISQLHTLDKSNLVNAMNELNSDVADVATEINNLETETSNKIGILTDLQTTNKTNLVGAVNEVAKNLGDNAISPDDFVGTDTQKVQQAINYAIANGKAIRFSRLYVITGNTISIDKTIGDRTTLYLIGLGGGIKKTDSGHMFTSAAVDTGDICSINMKYVSVTFGGTIVWNCNKLIRITSSTDAYIDVDTVAEANSRWMQSCKFINNTITKNGAWAFEWAQSYDCIIEGNTIEHGINGIRNTMFTGNPDNNTLRIVNNVIEGLGGKALELGSSFGVTISGNYMEANTGGYIDLDNSLHYHNGLTIEGNTIQPTPSQVSSNVPAIELGLVGNQGVQSSSNVSTGVLYKLVPSGGTTGRLVSVGDISYNNKKVIGFTELFSELGRITEAPSSIGYGRITNYRITAGSVAFLANEEKLVDLLPPSGVILSVNDIVSVDLNDFTGNLMANLKYLIKDVAGNKIRVMVKNESTGNQSITVSATVLQIK